MIFFGKSWRLASIIMIATMMVDIDHVLANPIYQANRCSIGFHPLHSLILMPFYAIACFIPKARLLGVGLIIHMLLDSIDCQINTGVWYT